MTTPDPTTPRFNHIAMSVPADLLSVQGRGEILDFYSEVFGWTEMPTLSIDGERLVLRAHSNEQFVFLVASESPMQCPATDHFGMSVATPEALHEILTRARKFKEKDDRVEIVESKVEDYKVLKLHSFYVGYRLPMMVEIQCYEWAAGVGADSMPDQD